MSNYLYNILTLIVLLLMTQSSFGQRTKKTTSKDPSKYIIKYDNSFIGIGPEVYYLPLPRTQEEVLAEKFEVLRHRYNQFEPFNDTIQRAIFHLEIIKSFEKTANSNTVNTYIKSNSLKISEWETIINSVSLSNNDEFRIGLLNEFAKEFVMQNNPIKAEELLQKAVSISSNSDDNSLLKSNLSSLYFYNKKYKEALYLEEGKYNDAINSKTSTEQGILLIKIAKLHAYNKNCNQAEEIVIKKAIPIFNKTKDYNNKVNAWVELAQMYLVNKRYPEAQWFLIQAKELADKKGIKNYNLSIEYLLGYAKFQQKNYNVSRKELETAMNYAIQEKNQLIELSSLQMLAQISYNQKKFNEAEEILGSYNTLKKQLF